MRSTTGRDDRTRRGVGAVVRIIAGAVALVVATAVPAAAHGPEAEIEVGEPEVGAGLEVTFPVRLTYAGDGHPVEAGDLAEMTVEASRDGELVAGAVEPGDAPGVYLASVVLPSSGAWDVTVTATDPAATATVPVVAEEPAPEPDDTTTTEAAPTTTIEPIDASDEVGGEIVDRDEGGSSATPIIVAMVVSLVVAAGAFVLIRRARARGDA